MNKLKMHSPDLTQVNIDKLAELFPNCVSEAADANGVVRRCIDFDQLRQELTGSIVEGPQERYQLNWPGKREALLTANAPIAKTLRPCRAESVGFDTTQNLFIEGDNLDALKLLQETYLDKVKMIFIDPPYNTGNDFLYEDDFAEDSEIYKVRSNQKDEFGSRLTANTESNGRFHSDWLSMMYSRLKLARNLLRDDGVIFLSIDDNEQANLKRMCDEVFGEENFLANFVWQSKDTPGNDSTGVAQTHNHIVVFVKSEAFHPNLLLRNDKQIATYKNPDSDPRGPWLATPLTRGEFRERDYYPLKNPSGQDVFPPSGTCWRRPLDVLEMLVADNRIWWGKSGSSTFPLEKKFLSEAQDGVVNQTWWPYEFAGSTRNANAEIKELFAGGRPFDTPKPIRLIQRAIQMATGTDALILDFFSGSATTAHAVMATNAEDGGRRRFILVQLPEVCDEKSEAFKAGYKNIAEIGRDRIRRAGKQIKADTELTFPDLDVGFRSLKIDSSNMKEVFYTPDAVSQDLLSDQVNNIREDRTSEDLLFQVLLDWGVDLALPIAKETIDGKTIYFVDDNALAACFDEGVSEDFVKLLAKREPLRVVFRDAGFATDSVKINVEQIFKLMSPGTEVKAI
jgi:adenine-specific DNA-methyltransferase